MDERRELIVHGTPVSVNSKGTRYNRWKQHVNDHAYESVGEDQKLDSLNFPKVSVLIAYFHQPDSQLYRARDGHRRCPSGSGLL